MRYLRYKNVNVRYNTSGNPENPAILLIHGYLESLEIWDGFADDLSEFLYVISLDLPGHGSSGVLSSVHRMDEMADAVYEVMKQAGVEKVHVAGHSMGGYVALAFRERYHHLTLSCILFHSTCYPDTPEKQQNRNREIALIREGKRDTIISTNIPRGFANDNLEKFSAEVERAQKIASGCEEQGIISLLNGMKERPGRCILLRDDTIPILVIAGRKDNYIPVNLALGIQYLGKNVKVKVLENSGHMGFIEEREESVKMIKDFILPEN